MANCPSLLLVKQMNCIVTLVRSSHCPRGLKQFCVTIVLPRTVARKYPSHSRDPFLDGEAILTLIHKRRIVVDRQIEQPRVTDEEWR